MLPWLSRDELRWNGIGHAERIALWAPNSPHWIIVALAIMAAGGVLVPIDDLSQATELAAALDCSGARLIFTSARHLADFKDALIAKGVAARLVDAPANAAASTELPNPKA